MSWLHFSGRDDGSERRRRRRRRSPRARITGGILWIPGGVGGGLYYGMVMGWVVSRTGYQYQDVMYAV